MKLKTYKVGYCEQIAKIANRTAPFKKIKFWARAFLLEMAGRGKILIDTGYGSHFFEATKKYPYRLYRMLTPVKLERDLISQLSGEVDYLIVTHFHPDHIGGLKDFPDVKWIYSQEGYETLKSLQGLKALRQGFIPGLLPEKIPEGSISLQKEMFVKNPLGSDFPAVDLFNDGNLFIFELPGHAIGQIGVAIRKGEKWLLHIADAAWSQKALLEGTPPHVLGLVAQSDRRVYLETFWKLHRLLKEDKNIEMITTHGEEEADGE